MICKRSSGIGPRFDTGRYSMAVGKTGTMILIATAGLLLIAGCANSAQTGMAVGVLAGAGLGQMIGGHTGATLAGAAIGGAAGYVIGNEDDKQRAEMERVHMRQEMDYVTVNITNSNGSISRVRLRGEGIGYVGARGEFYDHLPTQDELRPVYGF
jgi:hypothetical protein